MAQFAMVEELASLIKDNLHCKHLILSVEDTLVNFLQDDSSWDRVLKLEPMNPYERLLVHRLADIFGFSHQSVGEGEDRHLILTRCPETSVPSILVSDLMWQFNKPQPSMNFDILKRDQVNSEDGETRRVIANERSVEEREKAYFIARERIFSSGNTTPKQRPQNNPVVARRMITRALGKTSREVNQDQRLCNNSNNKQQHVSSEDVQNHGSELSSSMSKLILQRDNVTRDVSSSAEGQNGNRSSNEKTLRKEHEGAAKRLFANALGVQRRDSPKLKQPTEHAQLKSSDLRTSQR